MNAKKRKRMILEIGPGLTPVTRASKNNLVIWLEKGGGLLVPDFKTKRMKEKNQLAALAAKRAKTDPKRRPELLIADAFRMPLKKNTVDEAHLRMPSARLDEVEQLARAVKRVLAPGATVTASFPGGKISPKHPKHKIVIDVGDVVLKAFEKQGFTVENMQENPTPKTSFEKAFARLYKKTKGKHGKLLLVKFKKPGVVSKTRKGVLG